MQGYGAKKKKKKKQNVEYTTQWNRLRFLIFF